MRTERRGRYQRGPVLVTASATVAIGLIALVSQSHTQNTPRTSNTQAQTHKLASADPSVIIDGAKNPEHIPDDQAYHLVLMVASAAEDAPEVEKARAKAVRSMILGDDVPEFTELATHHRKTLIALMAEAAAGNADAERLKAEHLSRVKTEADLRLPVVAGKALAAYVKAEKANMKIHGRPSAQVVASPELLKPGTKVTALGYCDNEAGNLAPYCSDGCSGSRPCDKKCRRADESCTTCGAYGVCCCLGGGGGGGGGPTPTPTPTPPPTGMSGSPSGTTYTNTSVSGATFFATAITDSAASCTCHRSRATVTIRAPWGQTSNTSGLVGAYAQTTVSYQMSWAEFHTESEIIAEGEHYSFCPIVDVVFIDTRAMRPALGESFTALFKKSHQDATIGKWVYTRQDHLCTGQCQPPRVLGAGMQLAGD